MKIKATLDRFPAGIMVVPYILGAIIKTFVPDLIYVGGFFSEMALNPISFYGIFIFIIGTGVNFKAAPQALKIGFIQTFVKYLVAILIAFLVDFYYGSEGIFGVSTLAIIAAMSSTNGGLYSTLTSEFGNEEEVGAIGIIALKDGPFLTMIALGLAGILIFPLSSVIGVIFPLGLGILLGTLDPEMHKFFYKAQRVMILFFSFGLGCSINLETIYSSLFSGILLGVATTLICGFFTIVTDKLTGGTGVAGAANASIANYAIVTPATVALADPSYASLAKNATPQIAAAVVVTLILVPIVTAYVAKRNKEDYI